MIGVALSRWTMSYFATALIALIAAEGLMLAGFGYPNAAISAPQSLVLVHLVAIGWLSLLLCGALFQFVPVLVARSLYSNSLPLPTLALLVSGLCALLLGFLQLSGSIGSRFGFFPAAAILLGAGFALVVTEFFGWLHKHANATACFLTSENLSGSQSARDVSVVSAGVHNAFVLRKVRGLVGFLYGQSVHVSSYGNGNAIVVFSKIRHHAGFSDSRLNTIAKLS